MNLRNAVVRILNTNGSTVGTGFVTSDGLIVTCAHVVRSAGSGPGKSIDVCFYANNERQSVYVETLWWRDSNAEDVAILRLETLIHQKVETLILGSSKSSSGNNFSSFGFAQVGELREFPSSGEIIGMARHPKGWDLLVFRSNEIGPGMSGAPLFDAVTRRVVGMVNSFPAWTDDERRDRKQLAGDGFGRYTDTNFATSSETLQSVCKDLELSDIRPYQGLAAFTEEQAPFFFGREQLLKTILLHLRVSPHLLVLVGPSGSGKTSVVQAGLIPALRNGQAPGGIHYHFVKSRPGNNPYIELVGNVNISKSDDLRVAVRQYIYALQKDRRLLIFIDQLEELFTLTPKNIRNQFLNDLLSLLELPITVVLNIRADFYGHLIQSRAWADWLALGQVNVLPMDHSELEAAIRMPAQQIGLQFQDGLVETIITDIEETDHPLPLLEFALTQLWEQRREGMLLFEAYYGIGQVTGAISTWAEDVYNQLPPQMRTLARRLFSRLIYYGPDKKNDTRQLQTLDQLIAHSDERSKIHQIIQILANARLIITSTNSETNVEQFEIIHDALLWTWKRLETWRDSEREFLLWRQRLQSNMVEWAESKPSSGSLLHGANLSRAQKWISIRPDDLNLEEKHFVRASSQRVRKQRAALGISITIIVIILALALVLAWLFRQQALAEQTAREGQENITLYRQVVSESLTRLEEGQLDIALLLAVEAIQLEDSLETQSALLAGLSRQPQIDKYLRIPEEWRPGPIDISLDGKTLATTDNEGRIALWDIESDIMLGKTFERRHRSIRGVVFSPDGKLIASVGSGDGRIVLWSTDSYEPVIQIERDVFFGDAFRIVAFSPDGSLLASGGCKEWRDGCRAGEIQLWDINTGQPMGTPFEGHESDVLSLSFSSDMRVLMSASKEPENGKIRVITWDIATHQPISEIGIEQDDYSTIDLSPQGELLAVSNSDGQIMVFDTVTGKVRHELRHNTVDGYWSGTITFSPDGRFLGSGAHDGTVLIWDVGTGRLLDTLFAGGNGSITNLAFSKDGNALISNDQHSLVLWDLSQNKTLATPLIGHDMQVTDITFSHNGQLIASSSEDQTAILWSLASGEMVGHPLIHIDKVFSVDFTPDDNTLVTGTGTWDNSIVLWDVQTQSRSANQFSGVSKSTINLEISSDGLLLASVGHNFTLWDFPSGIQKTTYSLDVRGGVRSIEFSPDGALLAVIAVNGDVLLLSLQDGPILDYKLVRNWFLGGIAFSPDGERLAISTTEGFDILDIREHSISHYSFDNFPVWSQINGQINSLAFSPTGEYLAIGFQNGVITLWDMQYEQPFATILGRHGNEVIDLTFSPDGTKLASIARDYSLSPGEEKEILVWDVTLGQWLLSACRIANRNLSTTEWLQYFGELPYKQTCSNLP